jgi:hypothetical protein
VSRHHVMVTYWRDTASPHGSQTYTAAGDDPREVLELSNARTRQWMADGAIDVQEADEDDEETAETLGMGL